jgi:hypothetical protein
VEQRRRAQWLDERAVHPRRDRNRRGRGQVKYPQRVRDDLVKSVVARHAGDPQHPRPWGAQRQQQRQGIVVAGVHIEEQRQASGVLPARFRVRDIVKLASGQVSGRHGTLPAPAANRRRAAAARSVP